MNRSLYEKSKIVMLVLVLAVISNPLFAQDTLIYVNYDWSAKPVVYNIDTTALKDEHEIYLFNKKGYEFGYDATLNDQLVMFELKHCVIKVNSDDAIERNNKVYIPKQSGSVVVKQKARVIKKNGKVIELNESNIKQSIDEETQKGYNYFAIDNIEKGDQIEYMYIVKKTPELTGDCVYMQSSIPRLNSTLELLAPVNLILNFKSYNNFPVLLPDTSYSNKNYWKASLHYIEGLEKEEMASYYPNLMQVVFKLKDNLSKGTKDVISYSNVANNLYQVMYVNTTKSALANIKKMLKKINISATPSTAQKIRTIEDYIKLTYFKVDGNQSALDDLDFILENHKASTQGLTALFVSTLSAAGINHELVYTCSR